MHENWDTLYEKQEGFWRVHWTQIHRGCIDPLGVPRALVESEERYCVRVYTGYGADEEMSLGESLAPMRVGGSPERREKRS